MELKPHASNRNDTRWAFLLFLACMGFSVWGVSVGWLSNSLPGVEFRQAQTAISTHFIQLEDNFSLAYPTPVLGKPWSIPMEFPLYQWTTVVVSNVTGFAITKAGRLVSIVSFYLSLPALFLILDRWRVVPAGRWLVLGIVVTCPFYIFYARAFLIETMALMFALWFWVAFERGVEKRSLLWLGVAMLMGVGAGLVKVTTFMVYLIPTGIWSAQRLWLARKDLKWLGELGWLAGAVALPFAATLWWLRFADATKALNPMADFLSSEKLMGFNLGTTETRFSVDMWLTKARMVLGDLTTPQLLIGLGILALIVGRRRWKEIGVCLGLFLLPLAIFPALYTYHAYYYEANTVLLLVGLGFILISLVESHLPRWLVALVSLTVVGGQVYGYMSRYYPEQSAIHPGGDPLTQSLRDLTYPDEYLIVVGYDWNSMMPYYAKRRAIMFKTYVESDTKRFDEAFAQLEGEKLGALVIMGSLEGRSAIIERAAQMGLESTPLYLWHDAAVFLPKNRRHMSLLQLEDNQYGDLKYAPGVELPYTRVAGRWVEVSTLRPSQRYAIDSMSPRPVRFFSTYGPTLSQRDGLPEFGAHPNTSLVFDLPAGPHTLRTKVGLPVNSYGPGVPITERSDGIEIALFLLGPDGSRRLLNTRVLDPINRVEDRGRVAIEMGFALQESGEVELFIGPGPNGVATRDWATLERVVIE